MPAKNAEYAKQEALGREVEIRCHALAKTAMDYYFSLKITGHNPPTPPRPKHEILAHTSDCLMLLQMIDAGVFNDPPR